MQQTLGAPYLARFLRDVGFHEPYLLAFDTANIVDRAVVESHISQKTSEIWGTQDLLQVKILY